MVQQQPVKCDRPIKWKSIIGILLVLSAVVLNMPILFGVLYIIWAVQDISSGHAHVLEDVSREENRLLFWIIVMLWLGSGLYVIGHSLINHWINPLLGSDYLSASRFLIHT